MGLVVTHIGISDFRSYEEFALEPDAELTVLVGPNAAGKTNAMEAVHILATGRSFRRPVWADTVRWGAERARLVLNAEGDGRHLESEVVIHSSGKREFKVNGKIKGRIADAVRNVPCVVFTPDDLRLVKDSADRRRSTLDELGIQLSEAYAALRGEYEKVLKQRNAALKEGITGDHFQVLTDVLVDKGVRLVGHRRRLFERVAERVREIHEVIATDSSLGLEYRASWQRDGIEGDDREAFREMLAAKESEERRRGMTLAGPQRDDVSFTLSDRAAREFASQGQQRSIALAWKLAEVAVVTEVAGQRPVLLLDDVMSELDETRRTMLARYVGTAAQTFVTTTNTDYFAPAIIERARLVRI